MYDANELAGLNPPFQLPGLIVIDGPIGAGKTTFIGHLENQLKQSGARVKVVAEPVPENLEEYYKDPTKNVFVFQKSYVLRLFDHWAALFRQGGAALREFDFVLCDRYWASTRAFVKYHTDKGNLTSAECQQLTDITNLFISLCPMFPEYYIFLDEPGAECLARIKKRGRPGETEVGDAYMSEINEYIRRYNSFPFCGEGKEPNELFGKIDRECVNYICGRLALVKGAHQTKVLHITGVKENTTEGTITPECVPIKLGEELIAAKKLNLHLREFLTEEAVLTATTGKSGSDVLRVNEVKSE